MLTIHDSLEKKAYHPALFGQVAQKFRPNALVVDPLIRRGFCLEIAYHLIKAGKLSDYGVRKMRRRRFIDIRAELVAQDKVPNGR